jgi:hypothetical protein
MFPTPPSLMTRYKDQVELAANEVRAKRIRVILDHVPECRIDKGQCDCQLEMLLLQDLDRDLLWRLEQGQRVLVSFGDNRCRICGEQAAWCYEQDEDNIEMCRLCSRLFEREDRASLALRTYEAIGRHSIPPPPLHQVQQAQQPMLDKIVKGSATPLRAN